VSNNTPNYHEDIQRLQQNLLEHEESRHNSFKWTIGTVLATAVAMSSIVVASNIHQAQTQNSIDNIQNERIRGTNALLLKSSESLSRVAAILESHVHQFEVDRKNTESRLRELERSLNQR
jgi:hypothetical protein